MLERTFLFLQKTGLNPLVYMDLFYDLFMNASGDLGEISKVFFMCFADERKYFGFGMT